MRFPSPLRRGTLIKRYRRFLADVRLDQGETVTAHCPSPGTLRGCADPGSTVLLSDSRDPSRRHSLTWEITDLDGDKGRITYKMAYQNDNPWVVQKEESPAGSNHPYATTRVGWDDSGDFTGPRAWWAYLTDFARRLDAPIRVTIP